MEKYRVSYKGAMNSQTAEGLLGKVIADTDTDLKYEVIEINEDGLILVPIQPPIHYDYDELTRFVCVGDDNGLYDIVTSEIESHKLSQYLPILIKAELIK